ncbi:HD domain-containing protein [Bowmanella sp. Y26]|uniref:HDOD domain-containing protein n=1 Tax=Bowmanella yangjiangensis TaxID=2811230 RepID=UPI001BDCF1D5|nr:HDOD domain-containing protein [Bowmanella yangjiangensis]MBT1065073.1 HD domain-containing protein [Bowmanella yangjiangensis]
MTNPIALIRALFERYDQLTLGENCSQLEHAVACSMLAQQQGLGDTLSCAAFLHDIGHFIALERQLPGLTALGYAGHAELGAEVLSAWGFPPELTQPIYWHVQAKRYQAFAQGVAALSAASLATLAEQGGVMEADEAQRFIQQPFAAQAMQLRALDDAGKPQQDIAVDRAFWLERIERYWNNNHT